MTQLAWLMRFEVDSTIFANECRLLHTKAEAGNAAVTITRIERMDRRSGSDARFSFTAAGSTSTSPKRLKNEDAWFISPDVDVLIIADGVGGHAAGEVASQLAIKQFVQRVKLGRDHFLDFDADADESTADATRIVECIKDALRVANDIVTALGSGKSTNRPGTTIVLSVRVGRMLFVASVGDSRVYRLRSGKLEQITVDDSWVEILVTAGLISRDEARTHPKRNIILMALGQDDFEADAEEVQMVRMEPGDRYLLSSDGVHDALDHDVITELTAASTAPLNTATELVQQAVEAGSKDDVTCIVMDVAETS
jgi:serine/threonine protein phosphatase PrpC